MNSDTTFIILALFFVITIVYFRSRTESQLKIGTVIEPVLEPFETNNVPNLSEDTKLPVLDITHYFTEDGGITVHWNRPPMVVDYLAVIKDEEGDEEVKIYFKDTLSADCDTASCRYSFQNLKNGNKYSIVLASVSEGGISKFSKKINFTPTFQKMQCNANGTCSIVKTEIVPTLEAKLETILSDKDATKEVLSKCQNMLDRDEAVYDINQIYEADGYFKSVKDKLMYPEHLLLPIKKGPNSLAELVKHQLELGIININVHNQDIAKQIKQEKS